MDKLGSVKIYPYKAKCKTCDKIYYTHRSHADNFTSYCTRKCEKAVKRFVDGMKKVEGILERLGLI